MTVPQQIAAWDKEFNAHTADRAEGRKEIHHMVQEWNKLMVQAAIQDKKDRAMLVKHMNELNAWFKDQKRMTADVNNTLNKWFRESMTAWAADMKKLRQALIDWDNYKKAHAAQWKAEAAKHKAEVAAKMNEIAEKENEFARKVVGKVNQEGGHLNWPKGGHPSITWDKKPKFEEEEEFDFEEVEDLEDLEEEEDLNELLI